MQTTRNSTHQNSAHLSIMPLAVILGICLLTVILLCRPPAAPSPARIFLQTGEPCATCHVSPSGGGPRTPRGQAWVGEGKPGEVPDLVAALDALGVTLEVNEAYYLATSNPSTPPVRQQSPSSGKTPRLAE